MHGTQIDINALNPIERMELADALYDSAMREIDGTPFTPAQLAELDRRLTAISAGTSERITWEHIREDASRA